MHATLAQNLIDGRHLSRPAWVIGIEALWMVLLGLFAGRWMVRVGPVLQIELAIVAALAWGLFDRFVLFRNGAIAYTVLLA